MLIGKDKCVAVEAIALSAEEERLQFSRACGLGLVKQPNPFGHVSRLDDMARCSINLPIVREELVQHAPFCIPKMLVKKSAHGLDVRDRAGGRLPRLTEKTGFQEVHVRVLAPRASPL